MHEPESAAEQRRLSECFLSAQQQRGRAPTDNETELETHLRDFIARCQRAWPNVQASTTAFVEHIAHRLPADKPICDSLPKTSTDVWMAFACLQGDTAAAYAFEDLLQRTKAALQRKHGMDDDQLQETLQRVRELTTVGYLDRAPALAQYQGRSRLATWLTMIAKRQAVRAAQQRPHQETLDTSGLHRTPGSETDPEFHLLKRESKGAFRAAFRQAVTELSPADRNLLRFVVVDGLKGTQIAKIRRCDAATISRNLAKIRERLAKRTRALLCAKLGKTVPATDTMLRMIASQPHATFVDLLVSEPTS